jgi:hypothetical protein
VQYLLGFSDYGTLGLKLNSACAASGGPLYCTYEREQQTVTDAIPKTQLRNFIFFPTPAPGANRSARALRTLAAAIHHMARDLGFHGGRLGLERRSH